VKPAHGLIIINVWNIVTPRSIRIKSASSALFLLKLKKSPAKERRLKEIYSCEGFKHSVQRHNERLIHSSRIFKYRDAYSFFIFQICSIFLCMSYRFPFLLPSIQRTEHRIPALSIPVMGHAYLQKERRSKRIDIITTRPELEQPIKVRVFIGLFTRLNWKSAHVNYKKKQKRPGKGF